MAAFLDIILKHHFGMFIQLSVNSQMTKEVLFFSFFFSEIRSHYISLIGLELSM